MLHSQAAGGSSAPQTAAAAEEEEPGRFQGCSAGGSFVDMMEVRKVSFYLSEPFNTDTEVGGRG